MAQGAYTLEAKTVAPPLTLPVHFSIFTSLAPENHHVMTNADRPVPAPHSRTIVELAKMAGKTTAAFYNWENLRDISLPGFLDHALFMANSAAVNGDAEIAASAIDHILTKKPDFSFIYLGGVDETAHRCGFMSQEYLRSLHNADRAVGAIFDSLRKEQLADHYNILIQSDHGGVGNSHHQSDLETLTIPWIAIGPGITQGLLIKSNVTVLDTAPTLARLLKVAPDPGWQGRVIEEVLACPSTDAEKENPYGTAIR